MVSIAIIMQRRGKTAYNTQKYDAGNVRDKYSLNASAHDK